jgi:hypothetical protein
VADSVHRFLISAEFLPKDAVQRALQTGTDVRKAMETSLARPMAIGLDAANIARQGAEAGRLLSAAMSREIRIDPIALARIQAAMQSINAPGGNNRDIMRLVDAGGAAKPAGRGTPGYAEQLNYESSLYKQRAVRLAAEDAKANKAQIELLNQMARETDARRRVETTTRGISGALELQLRAIGREANFQLRMGNKIEAQREQEFNARGQVINAINKRTDQDYSKRGNVIDAINRRTEAGYNKQASIIDAINRRTEQDYSKRATIIDAINKRTNQEYELQGRINIALQKRKDAADRQVAADQAVATAVSFPGATGTTPLGVARTNVNNLERQLASATLARTTLLTSAARSAKAVTDAEDRIAAINERLFAARQAETAAAARAGQSQQGLGQQFALGFRGAAGAPYAQQIGQAFKFSVLYGSAYRILSALTATFAASLQEGIEFQKNLTELKLATGRSEESLTELANTLGQRSVEAGFAPSQGIQVGARSLGLYGATQASDADQDRIADLSARIVSRLAFSSGKQPADLQTNIAAIAQAFGGGAEQQTRVFDLDAYMSRRFGISPGSTIGAVSEAGTVGRAAGFSLEEVTAIAADIMSRTGQTESATAGYLAQIFSRGGEGTLVSTAAKYGIDPTLTLSDQIRELAVVYKDASAQERANIAASFGRGKVQNAAIALLQDFDEVTAASRDARGGAATGAGDEAFALRIGDIGGQLALTGAALKDFASALSQTGLLEVLGAGVVIFRELVESGTALLRLWNEIPGVLKATAAAAALLTLAMAKGAAISQVAGISASTAGMVGTGGRVIQTAGGVVPLASGAGVAAALGPAAAIVAALGGLYAVGELSASSKRLREAQESATEALTTSSGPMLGADDYLNRASYLRGQATDTRDASSGWAARVINLGDDRDQALATARRLEAEATRLEAAAKAADAATVDPTRALVTGFDADSLKTSMDLITAAGGTARERLDALTSAITGAGDAAGRAREAFDASAFATESAQPILETLLQNKGGRRILTSDPGLGGVAKSVATFPFRSLEGLIPGQEGGPLIDREYKDVTGELLEKFFTQGGIEERVKQQLKGVESLAEIDPKKAEEMARAVIGDRIEVLGAAAGQGGNLSPAAVAETTEHYVKVLKKYFLGEAQGIKDIIEGNVVLTQDQLGATVALAVQEADAIIAGLQETDYGGRIAEAQAKVATIKQLISQTPDGATPRDIAALALARREVAVAQFNGFEAARKAAQHNADSMKEVRAIGQKYLRLEINSAVAGRNSDLLAEIIGQAGDGSINMTRDAINGALKVARAARDAQIAMGAAIGVLIPALGAMYQVAGQMGAFDADIEQLKKMKDLLSSVLPGGKEGDVYSSGSDANLDPKLTEEAKEPGETALERAAARAAAYAARSESPIAQAKAQILSARAAMAKAEKGTVEYYNALGQYFEARNALTDAIMDYRNNLDLLNIDMTDPVAMANQAVRAARRKLASDRGKGADVIAADRVALRQAQADREATAFSTRLETVQTAEQLGRISHTAYIKYLENESRRLNRIKDRTFQQQDQLNQIDSLLQEASSQMEAQWNFGNINLPTPYQVRRFIAASDPASAAGGGTRQERGRRIDPGGETHFTTIHINGADTAKVKKVIEDVVGRNSRTITTSPRRRV